jgi:hypothetical protein
MFATKAASFAGEAAALQEDNGTPRQRLALSNVNLGAFFDKLKTKKRGFRNAKCESVAA